METKSVTIKQLFTPERRFLVPIFQRGYVWTLANQWAPLWADVVDQALVVRRELVKPSAHARKHFMGAIVLGADQNRVLRVSSTSVIDGQQRLTTLQILLAALRDSIAPIGNSNLSRQASRLVENEGEWQDPDERFKTWPTNAFQEDFRRVQTAKSLAALVAAYPQHRVRKKLVPPRPPVVEAYIYFSGAIDAYLRGSDEPGVAPPAESVADQNRAQELVEAIQTYLQLVTIELNAEDDPQVIFETLNYRGVPLAPSDLIRNFVFLYAQRHDEDPSELYSTYWRGFDENPTGVIGVEQWWRAKERQGRIFRERLDLFAFHYVSLRTAREIKIGHLFQEFRDWWDSGDDLGDGTERTDKPVRVASVELAQIRRSAADYVLLLSPSTETRLGVFASRLKRLDTSTVYPLLLWLCENREGVAPADFDAMLVDLESYLVRRAVCGLTAKGYNHIFLDLLRKLRRLGAPDRMALRNELASLQGESNVWPDDARFEAALLVSPLYASLGPAKTQMVLESLELALHTSKSEGISLEGVLSVEHVRPQTAESNDWPEPVGESEAPNDPVRAQQRWAITHSLGNLTLLTQPLNSSVSNGPFSRKRGSIALNSRLLLNAYFQKLSDSDSWDERQILLRSIELASTARVVWPHPGNRT